MGRLYLSPPDMAGTERERLLAAFDSNWITTTGSEVAGFEADLAAHTGAEAAVALSSGTAALHLALLLSGVRPDDEVWVSTLTFIAPANATRYLGARLRFLDSERETWNLDPGLLEDALLRADREGRLPAAVIAVDIYGQCAQLDLIAALCERFGVVMIEDAAEALGATWRGRAAGTWGRLGALSFNGNKIITTGGGGALIGGAAEIDHARYLAQQARRPVLHYEHTDVGFNYRMPNLSAAIGRGQLADLPGKVERRHELNRRYRDGLEGLPGVSFMPWHPTGRPNGWLTVIELDPEVVALTAPELCAELDALDIEARPAWKPMHLQPVFADVPVEGGDVAAELYRRGVCLPSGSSMTDDDVERVIEAVGKVLGSTPAPPGR